jgi:hypothetical protein
MSPLQKTPSQAPSQHVAGFETFEKVEDLSIQLSLKKPEYAE